MSESTVGRDLFYFLHRLATIQIRVEQRPGFAILVDTIAKAGCLLCTADREGEFGTQRRLAIEGLTAAKGLDDQLDSLAEDMAEAFASEVETRDPSDHAATT